MAVCAHGKRGVASGGATVKAGEQSLTELSKLSGISEGAGAQSLWHHLFGGRKRKSALRATAGQLTDLAIREAAEGCTRLKGHLSVCNQMFYLFTTFLRAANAAASTARGWHGHHLEDGLVCGVSAT